MYKLRRLDKEEFDQLYTITDNQGNVVEVYDISTSCSGMFVLIETPKAGDVMIYDWERVIGCENV